MNGEEDVHKLARSGFYDVVKGRSFQVLRTRLVQRCTSTSAAAIGTMGFHYGNYLYDTLLVVIGFPVVLSVPLSPINSAELGSDAEDRV